MKSVLIAAIGGQGGNVLTEWIFQAATTQGYRAVSVGLPGLAQRGGATSFYLEIAEDADGADPIFCQFPVPGHVDVIVAQEYLELGHVLQAGYGGPRTTIVASTHRIHSVTEKMPIAGGVTNPEELEGLARRFSARFVGVDAVTVAQAEGLDELASNAVLLGLLATSGALPIDDEHYMDGIKATAVAVERNIEAFHVGRRQSLRAGEPMAAAVPPATGGEPVAMGETTAEAVACDPLAPLIQERAMLLPAAQRPAFHDVCRTLQARFEPGLAPILVEAVVRLIDFQDRAYAERYLRDVERMAASLPPPPPGWGGASMVEIFAKNLATMMTYEDAVRVAQIKTSQARLDGIKARVGIKRDQTYEIVDFLKPDLAEIYGLFPYGLIAPIGAVTGLTRREDLPTLAMAPRTTTIRGYLLLRLLLLFKPLRPSSYRYRLERRLMDEYVRQVRRFAPIDYELGCMAATTGQMIKGYGAVRRRTARATHRYVDNVIVPLYEWERGYKDGFALTLRAAALAKKLFDRDEDGIGQAELLARRVLAQAHEQGGDRAALLRELDRLAKEVDPMRLLTPTPLRGGPRAALPKRNATQRSNQLAISSRQSAEDAGEPVAFPTSGMLTPDA